MIVYNFDEKDIPRIIWELSNRVKNLEDKIITNNKSEWIPIINRASNPMPKEHKVYLVTYRTLKGRYYVRDLECSYSGNTPKYIGWSKKVNGEVIAWMPLPEPYKEDLENE